MPESQVTQGYDPGPVLPSVDVEQFKIAWRLHKKNRGRQIAYTEVALRAEGINPTLDTRAAGFRVALLDALIHQGIVTESDAAVRVAASFPFELREPMTPNPTINDCFDIEGFAQQVESQQ